MAYERLQHELAWTGLGGIWIDILEQAGYHTLADLSAATDEELLAIPGLGPFKLRAIRKAAPRVTAAAVTTNGAASV